MTRISFDQLRAFLHVARLDGFGRAAEALGLTQPAITARIKNLEQAIGAEVFSRGPGGLSLTPRGEILLRHAEAMEQLQGMMERDVVGPDAVEGRLRLGVSETIAQCWLPKLVTQLHATYPRLEIEFHVDISTNLRAALLARSLDLVILLGPISEYSVENIALPDFDLAWYASASFPVPDGPLEHFSRPVLTYARQTRPYRELRRLVIEKVGPEVALFPSSSLSTCFRLVEADLGIAALPRALGRPLAQRGLIREFDPGWVPPPLHFTVSYLGEPLRPMVETAAAMALFVARDFDRGLSTDRSI